MLKLFGQNHHLKPHAKIVGAIPMKLAMSIPLVFVSTLITSCIPFISLVDYAPEMQGGKVTSDNCLELKRVRYQVEGQVDGISLTTKVAMYPHVRESAPQLQLLFSVPAGITAELLSSDISITASSSAGELVRIPGFSALPDVAQYAKTRRLNQPNLLTPLVPMVGADELRFGNPKSPRTFSINVPLGVLAAGDLKIDLPEMKITTQINAQTNTQIVKIPTITFKRIPRTKLMVPLNC